MRKRLIYRCDDFGYTQAFDMGAFKAIDEGIGTSADVMFDAMHAKEALQFLRERPWISVGWHRHLWGRPILPAAEVPSMVDENGKFKWRKNLKLQNEASYDDAYREFEAELAFCKKHLGRYPDVCGAGIEANKNDLERAYRDIIEKYDIARNFSKDAVLFGREPQPIDPKWEHLHMGQWLKYLNENLEKHDRWNLANYKNYTPEKRILSVEWTENEEIWKVGGHPGFLDDYILAESTCNIHRVKDVVVCCSNEVKQWIRNNHIELINQRDALYGTNEYQDHLKAINSPLWIGNHS